MRRAARSILPRPCARRAAPRGSRCASRLRPEDAAAAGARVEAVVGWFDDLQQVDVEGVPPAVRPDLSGEGGSGAETSFRADVPEAFEGGEALRAAAPRVEGRLYRVNQLMGEAEG